jgi:hypothetical protein
MRTFFSLFHFTLYPLPFILLPFSFTASPILPEDLWYFFSSLRAGYFTLVASFFTLNAVFCSGGERHGTKAGR